MSLIKHQVEEHFYEELENMFVEEFLRCSVCCKMDFKNTGLGMFMRHAVKVLHENVAKLKKVQRKFKNPSDGLFVDLDVRVKNMNIGMENVKKVCNLWLNIWT